MKPQSPLVSLYIIKTGMVEQLPRIIRNDEEWRNILPPASYDVARLQGTEFAFTGEYYATNEPGLFTCICCGTDLFSSDDKFDSGTGWPSFSRPVSDLNVITIEDRGHGMKRTEVRCARCDAHLGHVFDDGPAPSGLRYCMNSLSFVFVPR